MMTLNPHDSINTILDVYLKQAMAQREEILLAFVAKYGCHPDEIQQVELKYPDGKITWHVEKKVKLDQC